MFEEFNNKLDEFKNEIWMSFKAKIFIFQDFYMQWGEKILNQEKDFMIKYINEQVSIFATLFSTLKLLIGGDF